MAGKKQNLDPMWKVLNKEVDLGEPTSFLGHVYQGCTQRKCEISKDIVDNYRAMFESRISAGRSEKLPYPQNLRTSSWSYDMAGQAKKCVERYCELVNKTTQQLYKSHNKIDAMLDIDSVPSNFQSANQEALLYVFEDNEAVIKMIMKGRSPTMRHVSRTHRVALDWLFDRINLVPKSKSNTSTPKTNSQTF